VVEQRTHALLVSLHFSVLDLHRTFQQLPGVSGFPVVQVGQEDLPESHVFVIQDPS